MDQHPEIDDPKQYFKFEIDPENEGIRLRGINNRGSETINICKLNRYELKIHRGNVIKDFVDNLSMVAFLNQRNNDAVVSGLFQMFNVFKQKSQHKEFEHLMLKEYAMASVWNFTEIVLPFVENLSWRNTVKDAFIAWKCSVLGYVEKMREIFR